MPGVRSLKRPAPAKVNLYLRVVGRRADGYHLLDSLVVFVDLADRLTFSLAPVLRCDVSGPFARALAAGENLVDRAARLLLAEAPAGEASCASRGAIIAIEKEIPVAAGLGGGSADAAAALDGLNELWRLGLDESVLAALAPQLGADVAVCRFGRPALTAGTGEIVKPAPKLPQFALLLANPNRTLATADVFRRLAPPFAAPQSLARSPATAGELAEVLRQRGNALTVPATALCPQIEDVLAQLARLDDCLLAQMSGSGATCFGLFADFDKACRAAADLAAVRPHWFVRACRVLD